MEFSDSTGRFDAATVTIRGGHNQEVDVTYSDVEITFSANGWVRFRGKRLGAIGSGTRWITFTEFYPKRRVIKITTQGEKR